MAKIWRLFIWILSFFILSSIYNSAFAQSNAGCWDGCVDCETTVKDGDPIYTCKKYADRYRPLGKCPNWCCGIKLNTNFPIIWNCIETKSDEANPTNAFPYMMWALTKIIMSLIMVVCFILVIVSGIMRAWDKPKEWKELLKKVAITILLLWFSWVILRLINPNFFG